jgi:hypothetical protein
MKHTATMWVFADHYQFFVHGTGQNPFEPLSVYTDQPSIVPGKTLKVFAWNFNIENSEH